MKILSFFYLPTNKILDFVLIFSVNRNKVCKALIYNTIVYGGDLLCTVGKQSI
jgi:hypothetical protein